METMALDSASINWNSVTYSPNVLTYPQVQEYYYQTWYPYSCQCYSHPSLIPEKSKVDTAFKVLKALQDNKVINVTSVKKFIELVDEISKVL